MPVVPSGTYTFGPGSASLNIKTYREGVAQKVGHDLVIEVSRWEATVDIGAEPASSTVQLTADARSLEVREGAGGVKPLSDKDRSDIRKNIDEKVLRGHPITFRSSAVHLTDADGRLLIEGDLTIAGSTHPVTAQLNVAPDGRLTGTIPLTQSAWGIKPYRGLMGALKIRDELEIVIDAHLPPR
jgi:polyisoprenoid-binding protein YceI